jgi:hypothetical protein
MDGLGFLGVITQVKKFFVLFTLVASYYHHNHCLAEYLYQVSRHKCS